MTVRTPEVCTRRRESDMKKINYPTKLTPEELVIAQAAIDRMKQGCFKVKTILGKLWRSIHGKTYYGRRFSKSFDLGDLKGLRRGAKRSNSWTYIVVA